MVRATRVVVGVFVVGVAAACDSGFYGPGPPQPSPAPSPAPSASQQPVTADLVHDGHYRGGAALGGSDYSHHVEALVTTDGEVRLHVGGPGAADAVRSGAGVPAAALKPAEAALFVGNVSWVGAQGNGSGVVIGEGCTPATPGPLCGAAAPAELSATQTGARITGELRVTTARGVATWALDISRWSIYYTSAPPRFRGSLYLERLAQFAATGEPIITIDAGGRLFFQSAASGCIGNGTLAPHGDGRYVFDVDVVIESCRNEHASLNGRFEGFATETQDNAWGYDAWLVMWLTTPDGGGSRVALTTMAEGI